MFLKIEDLPASTRGGVVSDADLRIMLEDAQARAVLAAPCLSGKLTDAQRAQVVAVIRGALARSVERASRDDRQMSAGPFAIGAAPGSGEPRALFWPSELDDLRSVCGRRGRAYVGWLA